MDGNREEWSAEKTRSSPAGTSLPLAGRLLPAAQFGAFFLPESLKSFRRGREKK